MTFEELQKANDTIKTTDVKGKQYAEVNQRIKAFRMVFPNGTIGTEIVSLQDGICVMKAVVCDEAGNTLGIGHAYEKEGNGFINQTSYIENCETSAVGRALGMCGFGIDVSVASKEEVENAIHQQEMMKLASKPKLATIKSICEKNKVDADAWVQKNGKTWETLTEEEATQMLLALNKKYGDK